MTYKVVPGPHIVSISKGKPSEATDMFARIINAESKDGWTYHSMETLTVQEKEGCAFSSKYVNSNIYMLIFCHE